MKKTICQLKTLKSFPHYILKFDKFFSMCEKENLLQLVCGLTRVTFSIPM